MTVAVAILNFNNRSFLERFLPTLLEFSGEASVYVIDNNSSDDSVEFVRQRFPGVKLVLNGENHGYAGGYNQGLKQVKADIYALVNSDVEVTPGWLRPVVSLFEKDATIAAVQPKILDQAQRHLFEYAGGSGGYIDKFGYPFCRGRIFNKVEEDKGQYDTPAEIFWASGACLFVRSDLFWKVGGFDARYFAHMEEIDLCWRLKNFGYKIFAEPASVIYHVGGGTLNKVSPRKTYLNFRNNLSTLAKNYPRRGLYLVLVLRLILDGVAAFKFLFEGQGAHFIAVIHAHFSFYAWLPSLLKKRRICKDVPGFRFSLRGAYNASVVKEHFIGKKNLFTQLTSGFLR